MGSGSASRIDDRTLCDRVSGYAFVRRESEQNSSLQLNTSASIKRCELVPFALAACLAASSLQVLSHGTLIDLSGWRAALRPYMFRSSNYRFFFFSFA
jgi:hypothetical protein